MTVEGLTYSPDQPRDERGRWTPGGGETVRLYHGTRAENVESIRREGLRPTSPSVVGGAKWFQLTTSREQATRYSPDGTVVQVDIPRGRLFEHAEDSDKAMLWPGQPHDVYGHDATAYAIRQQIPPEYVTGLYSNPTAGANPSAELAFNPDQPRDEHGRWVGEGGEETHPEVAAATERIKAVFPEAGVLIDGMIPGLATEVADRVEVFAREFPEAAKTVSAVMMTDDKGTVFASTQHFESGGVWLQFNRDWYDNAPYMETALRNASVANAASGDHPLGTTQSTVDHELGHVLGNMLIDKGGNPYGQGTWFQDEAAAGSISRYATQDGAEAFSEAFSLRQAQGIAAVDDRSPALARDLTTAIRMAGGNDEGYRTDPLPRDASGHLLVASASPAGAEAPTCRDFVPPEVTRRYLPTRAELALATAEARFSRDIGNAWARHQDLLAHPERRRVGTRLMALLGTSSWAFNPDQPRDDRGRWAPEGGTVAEGDTTYLTRHPDDVNPQAHESRTESTEGALAEAGRWETSSGDHYPDWSEIAMNMKMDESTDAPSTWNPGSPEALGQAATTWQATFDDARNIQNAADALLGHSEANYDPQGAAYSRELLNALGGNGPADAESGYKNITDANFDTPIGLSSFGPGELNRGVDDPSGELLGAFQQARDSGQAVWDVKNSVEIPTGGTGGRQETATRHEAPETGLGDDGRGATGVRGTGRGRGPGYVSRDDEADHVAGRGPLDGLGHEDQTRGAP